VPLTLWLTQLTEHYWIDMNGVEWVLCLSRINDQNQRGKAVWRSVKSTMATKLGQCNKLETFI